MGDYVKIGELNTWYDEQGAGEPLVLLHGGLSTNETWAGQIPDFAARFESSPRSGAGTVTRPMSRVPCPMTLWRLTRSVSSMWWWAARRILWVGATVASSGCSSRWPVRT